jgi:hypothetical protein
MIFFSAVEGLCLASCTHASGERFILFKNPIKFLSYRSVVDGLMIAAENSSKIGAGSVGWETDLT